MEAPVLETLLQYHKENNLILSMPGNKCGKGFERDELGIKFMKNMGKLDITEVEPLDNLHCPEGIIKKSQEILADLYKSQKAYFLVNGSSCGNLSAIFSAFKEGDEVLVERNCHKSVYNGITLRKLKVTYIEPVTDTKSGLIYPVNEENINSALKKCTNPKGIILTYPNYFGIGYDFEKIILKLKERNIITIIDAAHGAHYGINEKLPKSLVPLGDYVICSAHKTIPALTQGAYLFVNSQDEKIEFYLKAFMTTSPSYLIMASLDYGRYYLQKYGREDYEHLIKLCKNYKVKINSMKKVKILGEEDLAYEGYNMDLTRYIIAMPKGYSGEKLLQYFRKNNIQCEMSFRNMVVMIFSPINTSKDFEKIYYIIKKMNMKKMKDDFYVTRTLSIPEKRMELYEALEEEGYLVDLEESEGKCVKDFIIPYPPGIPILCSGEIITKEIIHNIKEYINNNITVMGIYDHKILIIKKN